MVLNVGDALMARGGILETMLGVLCLEEVWKFC